MDMTTKPRPLYNGSKTNSLALIRTLQSSGSQTCAYEFSPQSYQAFNNSIEWLRGYIPLYKYFTAKHRNRY